MSTRSSSLKSSLRSSLRSSSLRSSSKKSNSNSNLHSVIGVRRSRRSSQSQHTNINTNINTTSPHSRTRRSSQQQQQRLLSSLTGEVRNGGTDTDTDTDLNNSSDHSDNVNDGLDYRDNGNDNYGNDDGDYGEMKMKLKNSNPGIKSTSSQRLQRRKGKVEKICILFACCLMVIYWMDAMALSDVDNMNRNMNMNNEGDFISNNGSDHPQYLYAKHNPISAESLSSSSSSLFRKDQNEEEDIHATNLDLSANRASQSMSQSKLELVSESESQSQSITEQIANLFTSADGSASASAYASKTTTASMQQQSTPTDVNVIVTYTNTNTNINAQNNNNLQSSLPSGLRPSPGSPVMMMDNMNDEELQLSLQQSYRPTKYILSRIQTQPHVISGLDCTLYGGGQTQTQVQSQLSSASASASESLSRQVYWKDIQKDDIYLPPFYHIKWEDTDVQDDDDNEQDTMNTISSSTSSSTSSSSSSSSTTTKTTRTIARDSRNKYLTYEPIVNGGVDDNRIALELYLILATAMGRILVLPPKQSFPYLVDGTEQEQILSMEDFFHLEEMNQEIAAVNIITMEEFLAREGVTGHMAKYDHGDNSHYYDEGGSGPGSGPLYPPNNQTNWNVNGRTRTRTRNKEDSTKRITQLWSYLRTISHVPTSTWNNKCIAAFPSNINVNTKHHNGNDELYQIFQSIMQSTDGRPLPDPFDYQGRPPSSFKEVYNTNVNANANTPIVVIERMRELMAHRSNICLYNDIMQRATVIHFPQFDYDHGDHHHDHHREEEIGTSGGVGKGKQVLFLQYYAFAFFEDYKQSTWSHRLIRDHLRYKDVIQCAASRIVHALKELSISLSLPLSSSQTSGAYRKERNDDEMDMDMDMMDMEGTRSGVGGDATASGGDSHGAIFHSLCLRHDGPMEFEHEHDGEGGMTVADDGVLASLLSVLEDDDVDFDTVIESDSSNTNPKTVLFVITAHNSNNNKKYQEKYLAPLRNRFHVVTISDFTSLLTDLNPNLYGAISQIIAAQSHTFVGSYASTYCGYIARLRGYYSVQEQWEGYDEGRLDRTHYMEQGHGNEYRIYKSVQKPFFAREFPISWMDIDEDTGSA